MTQITSGPVCWGSLRAVWKKRCNPNQTWPTKKSQVALFHSIKPLFRNRPLLIILNKLLGMTLDLSEELRSLNSGERVWNACLCDRFDLYEWKLGENVKPATNIREVLPFPSKWLYIYDAILSHISSLLKERLKLSLSIYWGLWYLVRPIFGNYHGFWENVRIPHFRWKFPRAVDFPYETVRGSHFCLIS